MPTPYDWGAWYDPAASNITTALEGGEPETADMIALRHRKKKLPPTVELEAQEPGVSDAGNGRYTFRRGKGASNEPVYTDRPEGMTYRPGAADVAASQLQNFMRDKYGADYSNERTVGTPEWKAGGAESLKYSQLFDEVARRAPKNIGLMDEVLGAWGASSQTQRASEQDLQKQLQGIDETARKRQEMEAIGEALGLPRGTPLSPEGLKTYTGVRGEQRAQAGEQRAQGSANLADRRERRMATTAENVQQWRMGQPPSPRLIEMRAEQLLADEGYDAVQVGRNWTVTQKNTMRPVEDSAKLWADAQRRAQQQLMGERSQGQSPEHPAVTEVKRAGDANPNDPRVIQYKNSLAALKSAHPELFLPDGRPTRAAEEEAAKQNFGR